MSMRISIVGLGLLGLAWMATVGCSSSGTAGEPTLHVKGKLTNGGKPFAVPAAMAQHKGIRPMVNFTRAEQSGKDGASVTAITEVDGSFEADVPQGKYRISVQFPYASGEEKELLSKFDQRSSTIEREITADGQEINVDLSNPNGS